MADFPTAQEIADALLNTELPGDFCEDSLGQRLTDLTDGTDLLLNGVWTVAEKKQIRDALGIDGDKTTSTGGKLSRMYNKLNLIFIILMGK